jgi:hypothetical protein
VMMHMVHAQHNGGIFVKRFGVGLDIRRFV